ncbi:MAG: hypothetical protein LW707_06720 [Sphingobacteriales bacterium]|jgi:hypothetical protein|nr:hypothetical protein [Sphingobacteriales bacterium]
MLSKRIALSMAFLFMVLASAVYGGSELTRDTLGTRGPTNWHAGFGGRFVRFENLRDGLMPENLSWFGDPYNRMTTNLWLQRSLPKNTLKIPFELRAGLFFERLIFDQEGTLDAEYFSCEWFNCAYLGETMKLRHDIITFGTEVSAILLPYRNRRLLGTSLVFYTDLRYLFVKEQEELSMNGAYQADPSTGDLLSYQTEYYGRTRRADQIGWEAGIRMEIFIGKHVSLILPQVGFQQSLELRPVPGVVYKSVLDGDQLALPARSNNLNKSTFLLGVNFHFF